MAPGKKNAAGLGARLVFVDESGFLLIPPRVRTWAPRGATPVITHWLARDRVSAISAVSISPVRKHMSLYFTLYRRNIKAAEVARFLSYLLAHIPGQIIVLWDNNQIHKGVAVKKLCERHARLHVEFLPAYAPELNPDEGVWSQLKRSLANGRPEDVFDLSDHLLCSLADIRNSQSGLRACVHRSGLPLF